MSAMEELNGLPKIPPTWSWSTINNACLKVQDGTHFSPQNQLAQGAYRYITAKNVRPSGLDLSNVSYLAEDEHRAIYKRCDPRKGDVLLVKDGVNTGDAAVNTLDEEFSLLSSVCLLRPRPALLYSQFLRYYLLSPVGYRMLTGQMTGTAIKRIILGRIKESPVPIAPLDEQRTIVAEIEKQFSRLDEAVANIKRVKANLKRYKSAVLKAAVEGKLTEDWRKQHPDVEPASKLLERILAERRAKWKGRGKYQEPSTPDTSGLPKLLHGWIWAPLEAISEAIGGFAFESKKFTSTGFQVIKMGNIRMGRIDVTQKPSFIQDVEADVAAKYGLIDGDLVVTLTGTRKKQDYGYVAVVKNAKGLLLNQRIARLRPADGVLPRFLELTLQSEDYRSRFFAYETGNVGQGNVGMGAVTKVLITLAPFVEQQYIVGEVERRLSVIDELEATIDANLTRADRLRQSILARAFSGNLACSAGVA